jgi:hypothetical protein
VSAAKADEGLSGNLRAEHRQLDALFGEFLAAASSGDTEAAAAAIAAFDDDLRRHTALEEERLFPPAAPGKLVAPPGEDSVAALGRQLRLEHVQIRELSGMMRRLLAGARDLEGARRLAGGLARRWDAHTAREEAELLGSAAQ